MGDPLDDLLGLDSDDARAQALETATYGQVRTTVSVTARPLVLAVVATLASGVLRLLATDAGAPTVVDWIVPAVGYLLTPWVVLVALAGAWVRGLDAAAHPRFDVAGFERRLRPLQLVAVASFVVAFPHVRVLAQYANLLSGSQ